MRRYEKALTIKNWLMIAAVTMMGGCGSGADDAAFTISSSSNSSKQKNSGDGIRVGSVLLEPSAALAKTLKDTLGNNDPIEGQEEETGSNSSESSVSASSANPVDDVSNQNQQSTTVRGNTNSAQELEAVMASGGVGAQNSAQSMGKIGSNENVSGASVVVLNSKNKPTGSRTDNSETISAGANQISQVSACNKNPGALHTSEDGECDEKDTPFTDKNSASTADDSESTISACIWPPNNKYVNVTISPLANEKCQIVSVVNSDTGTSADSKITGSLSAAVKASRYGQSVDGRRYTIKSECSSGPNFATQYSKIFVVLVPHDQRDSRCK